MKIKSVIFISFISLFTLCGCSNQSHKTYNVKFEGDQTINHLKYLGKNTASSDDDFTMSFAIDYNYELLIDNINVSINGIQNDDCWSFLYQTNVKNIFTINKNFINGDLSINAFATYRTSTPSEYGYIFDDEITNICDCRFSDDRQPKFIPTLDQVAYPVMEDDPIEVIITLKDGILYEGDAKRIMDNIWFRTNARYTLLGEDFFKTYSNDFRECRIRVPHYIIRDHGSFKVKS
ncbi:MAG: hypothetical protein MJ222_03195 [Bacilli bacterium]|nr:hypothetical protein [Bacilli bacterium]